MKAKKNIVTVFVFPNLFPLFQFVAIKVVKKQSQEQVEHHKVSHYKCWDEDCEAGPWGALQHKITNNRTTIAKLTALVWTLIQSHSGSIHSPHNIRNIIMKEWKKSVKFHLKYIRFEISIFECCFLCLTSGWDLDQSFQSCNPFRTVACPTPQRCKWRSAGWMWGYQGPQELR